MAAEIKPVPSLATSSSASARGNQKKPILLHKIEGYDDDVNQAVILPGEDGVIAVCDDRYVAIKTKTSSKLILHNVMNHIALQICESVAKKRFRPVLA